MRSLLFALVPLPLFSSVAFAAVTLDSQVRSTASESHSMGLLWEDGTIPLFPDFDPPSNTLVVDDLDGESAANFDPFLSSVATADPAIVIVTFSGSGSASQDSTLSTTSIQASGDFTNAADAFFLSQLILDQATAFLMPPAPYIFGLGLSSETSTSGFSADFSVDEPTPYALSGSLVLSAPVDFATAPGLFLTSAQALIELREDGGALVAGVSLDQIFGTTSDIDATGLLPAGSYTLVASATGTSIGSYVDVIGLEITAGSATGSFDASLVLGPAAVPALSSWGIATLLLASIAVVWLAQQRSATD
jgi:hypothetical protein